MIKLYKKSTIQWGGFIVLILTLSGCSSSYSNSSARVLPSIPEIRSNIPRPNTQVKRVVRKAPAKPRKAVARVKKYSITSSTSTVITQQEVNAVNEQLLNIEKRHPATVDIDPYDAIPDNSSSMSKRSPQVGASLPTIKPNKSSSAVTSLMSRARADLAIGRTQSAVSKLERGLRIESQNPNIWHLLAKAHYDQRGYQQAINMAKKSIRYASGDTLITQNWQLIKKAAEKSEDTIALKEALDYFKVNP